MKYRHTMHEALYVDIRRTHFEATLRVLKRSGWEITLLSSSPSGNAFVRCLVAHNPPFGFLVVAQHNRFDPVTGVCVDRYVELRSQT